MFELLKYAGIVSLLSIVVGVLPLGAGIAYAIRPTEQRLALMRPLSLAAIFAGSCGLLSGLINGLRLIAISDTPIPSRRVALWGAESLMPLFIAFGCLTVAWLCAATALRRHP
jgi:hypothetical protein